MEFRVLTAADVECRVQSTGLKRDEKSGKFTAWAVLLVYKNARTDRAILNETCGKFGWKNSYELINDNLFCTISVKSPDGEWISKQDVGVQSNTEREKGQASDALKRAAFAWGIGEELYSCPRTTYFFEEGEYRIKDGKAYPQIAFEVEQLDVDKTTRRVTALRITKYNPYRSANRQLAFEWTSKKVLNDVQLTKLAERISAGENLTEQIRDNYFVTAEVWQKLLTLVSVIKAKKVKAAAKEKTSTQNTNNDESTGN